jgi:hypothetical protein
MGLPAVICAGLLTVLPCVALFALRWYIKGNPVLPTKNRLDGKLILITGERLLFHVMWPYMHTVHNTCRMVTYVSAISTLQYIQKV